VERPAEAPSQRPGSLGRRAAAAMLDAVVIVVGWLAVFFTFALALGIAIGFWEGATEPEAPDVEAEEAAGDAFDQAAGAVAVVAAIVVPLVYFTALEGVFGATLGKRLLGLRVIRADGSPTSVARAFVRAIGRVLSIAIGFLGYAFALASERRQTLHDLLADTVVVDNPRR
jgi:uncharacterized RDD family membrane protein YckC